MLQIVDAQWKDHLYSLDHLKEGIGLRGYGQRDPLVEYKKESFALFQAMKDRIDEEMVRYLWRLRPVVSGEDARRRAVRQPAAAPAAADHAERRLAADVAGGVAAPPAPLRRRVPARPGRRAPAATTRRSRRCGATSRRSAATIRARAAAARNTRSVTEHDGADAVDGDRQRHR